MKKDNPSKVIIVPRPPLPGTQNPTTNSQTTEQEPKSESEVTESVPEENKESKPKTENNKVG